MRRAPPPLPPPRSQAGLWPRPSLPWQPPAFPAQPRRPPAARGCGEGRGGAGPHRAPRAIRARRLRPTASISLHGAVGSGPRGCAGVAVPCQPRTPPSPRWIGAAGPARRRPRSVSRQRRRGRAGREQVRRRRCRPRTGASEQTDPRLAPESGWEESWLGGPAAGGDPHGGPVSLNTPPRSAGAVPGTGRSPPGGPWAGPALPLRPHQPRPSRRSLPHFCGAFLWASLLCHMVGLGFAFVFHNALQVLG